MRSLTVAEAKANLSSLLKAVEAGEDIEITRRGIPVARLCPATPQRAACFDLSGFLAETEAQPLHPGPDAATFSREMRESSRF
jgi:prevent-host-death family protein